MFRNIRLPSNPFIFWIGFLLANILLFVPPAIGYYETGALPAQSPDQLPDFLRWLFIRTTPDPFRLSGELFLLALLLYLSRKQKRWFQPLAILSGFTFVLLLFFQIYLTGYLRLYGIPPKIAVDWVLIREVLPIFLSSVGADRFWNIILVIGSTLVLVVLFFLGYRLWLRSVRHLPNHRGTLLILGALLLISIFRLGWLPQHGRNATGYTVQWLIPELWDVSQFSDTERLWSLGPKLPYSAYREQELTEKPPHIVLLFVESYGAVATLSEETQATYAQLAGDLQQLLTEDGWRIRSTYSHAPILGGRSWLSFTSGLCGLHIANQIHYNNLLYSNPDYPHWPDALNHFGYDTYRMSTMRTSETTDSLIPHRVLNQFWKFDHFIEHKHLPYRGYEYDYFGGIPDQYSLGYVRDSLLSEGTNPYFLFFITMSSHTPWYPPPPVVSDWKMLDQIQTDPTGYARQLPGNKIDRYFQSIRYELEVITDFIRRGPNDCLYILVGDHQPAALEYKLWGKFPEDAVPVHIIGRDSSLLTSFSNFSSGLLIDTSESNRIRHESLYPLFMDRFLRRYGSAEGLPGIPEFGLFPPDPLPDGNKIR